MFWIIEEKLGTSALGEEIPEESYLVDVMDLVDGEEEPRKIKEKVDLVLKALKMGKRVIIRCVAGISRSNAIAITVLTYLNGKSWEENEYFVRKKVPRTQINLTLKDSCKKTLEEVKK